MEQNKNILFEKIIADALSLSEKGKTRGEILDKFPAYREELAAILSAAELLKKENEYILPPRESFRNILENLNLPIAVPARLVHAGNFRGFFTPRHLRIAAPLFAFCVLLFAFFAGTPWTGKYFSQKAASPDATEDQYGETLGMDSDSVVTALLEQNTGETVDLENSAQQISLLSSVDTAQGNNFTNYGGN